MRKRKRDKTGQWVEDRRNYAPLLRFDCIKIFANSIPATSKHTYLHALKWFVDYIKMSPNEFISLPDDEIKKLIKKACLAKLSEEKYSQNT
ncbi:MAG: hypothetical protein ACTSXW_03360 [Candidatus Baldrarchaeia archaeon]